MNTQNRLSVMLDCSRNAVMNINALKKYIDILAKFGYNSLMLYTEDTYEIKGEPYFGYLRGRYSHEELKEIDCYAASKGIELIPCIQTLAHLNAIFRWTTYAEINDCNDILLLEDEKTYQLIDKMFETLSECFTSRIVNVGMDEAHMMGLGKYLDKHGYQNRHQIFLKHLDRVVEISTKYGFKPIMWSDMFYRMACKGEYYEKDAVLDPEVIKLVPKQLGLIYWDYYHKDKEFYDSMIKGHKEFNNDIWFAGGSWTWTGFTSQNQYGLDVTDPAMRSCHENGIKNIIMTQWKDNGGECSFFTSLPVLFYAAKVYNNVTDMNIIKKEFYDIMGVEFDDMMKFDLINHIENKPHIDFILNPSKYMLYNDPFMGICDCTVVEGESQIYKEYAKMYQSLKKKMPQFEYICNSYKALCEVLVHKYELGIKTRKYYKEKNLVELGLLVKEYDLAIRKLRKFIIAFRNLWFTENKPHGFDVQEIRLGGTLLRLQSCKERISNYLNGKIDIIEELEEDLLDLDGKSGKNHRKMTEGINGYQFNATANIL